MPTYQDNIQLGKYAEKEVATYFSTKGFVIKAQNYRFRRAEIDIIIQSKDLLIFVEVKARSSGKFGYPESFVRTTQKNLYQRAACQYIENHAWQGGIRFDIVALCKINNQLQLTHFEDAF